MGEYISFEEVKNYLKEQEAKGILKFKSSDDVPPFEISGFSGVAPPPRPWAYGDIAMYGAVTGIGSPPGVGKTTFSFELGIAFALDMHFGPWSPRPGGGGKVWIYNGEEPKDELDRRFLAACMEMGIQEADAAERLRYNSGLDRKLTLLSYDPDSGLPVRSGQIEALKDAIIDDDIKLFIVDPLIEFHETKENDLEAFKTVGSILREIAIDGECAVMLFHHTPKNATGDNSAGDMRSLRGGSQLVGLARFVHTMFEMTKADAERLGVPEKERVRYVRFDDAKANMTLISGEPGWWVKLGVSLENATDVRPSDVVGVLRSVSFGPSEDKEAAKRLQQADHRRRTVDRIADEIVRVCRANGHLSFDKAGALDAICKSLNEVATGVSKNTAKDIVTGEIGEGIDRDGWRVVITTVPHGKYTLRKVHVEPERRDG